MPTMRDLRSLTQVIDPPSDLRPWRARSDGRSRILGTVAVLPGPDGDDVKREEMSRASAPQLVAECSRSRPSDIFRVIIIGSAADGAIRNNLGWESAHENDGSLRAPKRLRPRHLCWHHSCAELVSECSLHKRRSASRLQLNRIVPHLREVLSRQRRERHRGWSGRRVVVRHTGKRVTRC